MIISKFSVQTIHSLSPAGEAGQKTKVNTEFLEVKMDLLKVSLSLENKRSRACPCILSDKAFKASFVKASWVPWGILNSKRMVFTDMPEY